MWLLTVVVAVVIQTSGAQWWNSAVYYRILVDSFKDGDGDGLGDIKGVTKQMSYIKAIGADAVILSPVVSKSTDCSSPGVTDFEQIDQRYGTLDGFLVLLEKAQKLDLKVVITLPLQTISTASEWFNSSANKVTGFEDRLIWKEGSVNDPPPAEDNTTWTWNGPRSAFFASSNKEARLNLCSEAVMAALAGVQCSWIRREVAGVLLNPDFPKDLQCGEKLVRKMAAEAATCARAAAVNATAILVESSLSSTEAAMYYADGGVGASSVLSNVMTSTSRSAAEIALEFYGALLNSPQDTVVSWLVSVNNSSADGSVGASSVLSNAMTSTSRSAADIALGFYGALLNSPQDTVPSWLVTVENTSAGIDYAASSVLSNAMTSTSRSAAEIALEFYGALLNSPLDTVPSWLVSINNLAAGYGIGASSVLIKAITSTSRSAADIALGFYGALLNSPQDTVPSWLTSAPYASRITTRYGTEMIDAINLLTLTLPGATVIQQGDELGAADTILEWATSEACWPSPSLPSSAPFPWDDTTNGGFTSGDPWLPMTPNYRYANAKAEFANDVSHVGAVRVAAAMRRSPAMGPNYEIKRLNNAVAILRWGDTGSLLAVANVAKQPTEVQLNKIPGIPAEMTVATSSAGSSQSAGSHLHTEKTLKLAPGETVLLAGPPRHCGGPGPVDKIATKLSEGWQKINKYFS